MKIEYTTYRSGNLAVLLDDDIITVNLSYVFDELGIELPDMCAYVDINNRPDAIKIIEDNGIATPLGLYCQSGFVNYPLYRFNKEYEVLRTDSQS